MVSLLKAGLRQLSVPRPSVTAAHLPDTLSHSSAELLCYVNACRSLTSPTQPRRSCSPSARLSPHQHCQWSRTTSVQSRHIPTILQMLLRVQIRSRMGKLNFPLLGQRRLTDPSQTHCDVFLLARYSSTNVCRLACQGYTWSSCLYGRSPAIEAYPDRAQ